MRNEILVLIDSYVKAVRRAVALLCERLHTTDLLEKVQKERGLRQGKIDSTTAYAFHGVGCRVTMGDTAVDFDFGPNGKVGGFDAWRLWRFAEAAPLRFPQWQNRDSIERALKSLHAQGLIAFPRSEPSPHLYYTTPEGERAIAEIGEVN